MGRGSLPQRCVGGADQTSARTAVALDAGAILQTNCVHPATRARGATPRDAGVASANCTSDLRTRQQFATGAPDPSPLLRSANAFIECRSDAPAIPAVPARDPGHQSVGHLSSL